MLTGSCTPRKQLLSDRRLVRRILEGDTDAAESLVRQHYPGIHRFLRHLTQSPEDALDLVQQTFIRARESLPSFRRECPLRSWLYRIAYREYLHWLRTRTRKPETSLNEEIVAKQMLSDDALVLADAIQDLPEELRGAFLLREVEQLSVKEVAEALDIPEGTVKSRCYLARKRLQESLAGTWEIPNLEVDHAK